MNIDLASGYDKLRIKLEDILKITVDTRYGHHEFIVMPIRCITESAASIDFMNRVFRPYLDKFLVAFISDVLIYSKGKEDNANNHLETVL